MGDTQIATGLTVSFGTSNFDAKITEINQGDVTREARDTSHMGTTTARTYKPSKLYDPGELDMTILFDPGTQPPITAAPETITITFPDGEKVEGTGFLTAYSFAGVVEEEIKGNVKIKWSGVLTHSPASP